MTTAELKNLKVSGSGDKAEGRVYTISLVMTLTENGKNVFEQTFSEIYENNVKETMETIRVRMKVAKVDFEEEQTMKSDAMKEIAAMTDSINL